LDGRKVPLALLGWGQRPFTGTSSLLREGVLEKIAPIILIVDDEVNVLESFKIFLKDNYNLFTATSGEDALKIIEKGNINLVLLDIMLPDSDGVDILRQIKERDENIEVIMVTAIKTVNTAIQAMKLGAYDYITKPFNVDEVLSSIEKCLEKQRLVKEITYLRAEVSKPFVFDSLVGGSERMRQLYEMVKEVARSDATVLITGESGTGKELIARAVHFNSSRKDNLFIAVDCATLPENLVESELFGHEKGAFTDATEQKIGRFEFANGGTIFLDEIGNLKPEVQSKLLRIIEEKEIQRIGGTKTIKVDVRVISATNIDLKKAVEEGKFREDLYYRLNVIPVLIPPLRERKEDIPVLIEHFLKIYNQQFRKKIKGFSALAMEYLFNYYWPGNIRELRNVIERLVVLEKEEIISHQRLPLDILLAYGKEKKLLPEEMSFKIARREFERQYIIGILEKTDWNQSEAARLMGVHRNTLLYKMSLLGIKGPRKGSP